MLEKNARQGDFSISIVTYLRRIAGKLHRSLSVEQRALHSLINKEKMTRRKALRAIKMIRELQGIKKATSLA